MLGNHIAMKRKPRDTHSVCSQTLCKMTTLTSMFMITKESITIKTIGQHSKPYVVSISYIILLQYVI